MMKAHTAFTENLVIEARNAKHWYESKVRVSKNPIMNLSTALYILDLYNRCVQNYGDE